MENYNYNPGVFGSNFNWWIGQIVDSSFWRDNVYPSKYSDPSANLGWGRRYKVRIIGLHDIQGKEIPSEQLPWAQIIYPVTAGGGQAESYQSPNLRQGNMVFGFFFDGPDMQVPVILGVIGNNSKNVLPLTSEDGRFDANSQAKLATSGYARPANNASKVIQERIPKAPDEGLVTKKPGSAPDPEVFTDEKFFQTDEGKAAKVRIENEANILGLSDTQRNDYIKRSLENAKRQYSIQSNSPKATAQPGATRESVDNPHQVTIAQAKQTNLTANTKIPFIHPGENKVESALKAIQSAIDNLLSTINNYIHSFQSYIDQASNIIDDITNEIKKTARQISKYLKVLLNKMREYLMKILNKAMAKVVSLLPQSLAHEFSDIKQEVLDLIYCLFNKMIEKMDLLLANLLIKTLNIEGLEEKAQKSVENNDPYYTTTNETSAMCYTENVVAGVVGYAVEQIDEQIDTLLNNVDKYANLAQEQLAQVDDQLENVSSIIEDIQSSLADAAAFINIRGNIFGCEISVPVTMADFYTLSGGSAQPQFARVPSRETIESIDYDNLFNSRGPDSIKVEEEETIPFAIPSPGQSSVNYRPDGTVSVQNESD